MKRFAFFLLAAACGGSSSSPPRASVTGSVGGTVFAGTDSAAIVVRTAAPPVVDLVVTNLPDSCAFNGANIKSKQVLSIAVSSTSGLDAGTYAVIDSPRTGNTAIVEYDTTTAACANNSPPNNTGASGRVTLTRVDLGASGGLSGDFDIILQSGDRLKGTFNAPICPDRPDGGTDAGCH